MNDFLPQLKKLQPITIAKSGKTMTDKEIFFMIKTGENDTFIIPVDKKLKPVEADYHYYSGDTAQLLRSIDSIKEEMAFQISWDESEATDVSLSQNPHLLYQLIRCTNLIDEKGHAISVHPDPSVLQLVLKKFGRNIEPHFIIAAKESSDAEEYDGAKKYEANKLYFSLLSDCFVLSDNVIYPIAPIGDNYQQLSYFTTRFAEDLLEEYLSVFFSFIENVQVAYEDYTVEFSDTDIVPTPSLSFEKIDADKTLFLRLVESYKGLPLDFVQQFDLSMAASLSLDQKIVVKRLAHLPIDEITSNLRKEIIQYAPSKVAQKEVYVEDNLFIIPEETAGPFLLQSLPSLLRTYQLIGAEKLREYKVKPMTPKLNISLSSGIDFLEGDASITLEGEQFSLQQILSQYNKKKYIQLSDGNRAIIEDGYMRRLERIFKKKDKDGKVKVSFFDLPEIEDLINEPLEGEAFKHHRKVYEGFKIGRAHV